MRQANQRVLKIDDLVQAGPEQIAVQVVAAWLAHLRSPRSIPVGKLNHNRGKTGIKNAGFWAENLGNLQNPLLEDASLSRKINVMGSVHGGLGKGYGLVLGILALAVISDRAGRH